ncbi:hypothetical protein EVAR_43392_1 [Eumeta japonica]|uniref:Uncharacterized protein n=1 Tax=Eumeta variegata TaxID=151549 RepID=A0A4C1WV71_EUMVA|nr:hypothetical protein EVAR_43392_1 [Eumeta japonica]
MWDWIERLGDIERSGANKHSYHQEVDGHHALMDIHNSRKVVTTLPASNFIKSLCTDARTDETACDGEDTAPSTPSSPVGDASAVEIISVQNKL